jgi:hypothetical protein
MSAPANLLAEEGCLPAALLKSMASLSFYHAAPAIRREHRRSAASMKYFFPAPTCVMKYHSAPLIPHKSALMSAPANLLAEEGCLPAAEISMASLSFYHAAPAIRREHRRSAASMKYFFPAPANLLAEEGCLPAALLKKSALEKNISWMQRYAFRQEISRRGHEGGFVRNERC